MLFSLCSIELNTNTKYLIFKLISFIAVFRGKYTQILKLMGKKCFKKVGQGQAMTGKLVQCSKHTATLHRCVV